MDIRPIPGYEHYFATAAGEIISRQPRFKREHVLRPAVAVTRLRGGGTYQRKHVMLGRGVSARVHRLVCLAFHGLPPSPEHEVAHLNGDPMDNRAANLAWKTKTQNEADKIEHETGNRGSRHGMHKLTEEQVREMRTLANTWRQKDLAERYGVSQTTISNILTGRRWSWLE